MDGQELYNLYEVYMEVVENQKLDEGYKPPRGKMARRVAHKMFKAVNTIKKASDAGENPGTAGGQIANQKSENLGKQAQKIYQTAKRHNPEASKKKERQNRAVGDMAREVSPRAAATLRDRFKKRKPNISLKGPRPNTPKKKNNLGVYKNATIDGIIDGINDALGEQVDLYDIILSHLLDEGYAETLEAAEVMMVNMSEEWRDSIMEGYKRYPSKKVGKKLDRMYNDPDTDTRFGKTGKRYGKMMDVDSHMKGEVHPLVRAYSPKKSKAKESENRARGQ